MPNILFVCTGNRNRSPLAAALFSRSLNKRFEGGIWNVSSAGTWTQSGLSADPLAQRAGKEIGVDIKDHLTRPIHQQCFDELDLIVVMEEGQKEALLLEFPEVNGKVHLLSHLAGEIRDIPDPAGKDLSFYLSIANELVVLMEKAFDRICQICNHPKNR